MIEISAEMENKWDLTSVTKCQYNHICHSITTADTDILNKNMHLVYNYLLFKGVGRSSEVELSLMV